MKMRLKIALWLESLRRKISKKSLPNLHIPNIFYIFAPEIDQIYSIIYYVYNTKGNKN
jgi:hypothetical protein